VKSTKLEELCLLVRPTIQTATTGTQDGEGTQSSVSSQFDHDDDDIDEIAEDLRIDARYLVGLNPLLKHPVPDEHPQTNPSMPTTNWTSLQDLQERIESLFPMADTEHVSLLAKLNHLRRSQFHVPGSQESQQREQHIFRQQGYIQLEDGSVNVAEMGRRFDEYTRLPSAPGELSPGTPFRCVGCGRMVSIRDNTQWMYAHPPPLSIQAFRLT
jgi:hypothetical protein